MSDRDYQIGREGGQYAPGMNYEDYKKGAREREFERAGGSTVFMPEGPSLGIAAVPLAFLALVMYPVAGLGSLMGLLAVMVPMEMLKVHGGFFFLVALGGAVAGFLFALKFERQAAQNAGYRAFRLLFRLIIPTIVFVRMATRPHAMATARDAGPMQYLAALVVTAVLVWVFSKLDRRYRLAPASQPAPQPAK
jgi:hypothetical protein